MNNLAVLDNGLVNIYDYQEKKERIVDARELHEFLEIGKDFTSWIKLKITKYGFKEGEDYYKRISKVGNRKNVIRHDYYFLLNAALVILQKSTSLKQPELYMYLLNQCNNENWLIRENPRKKIEFTSLLVSILDGITKGSQRRLKNYNFNPLTLIKQASFNNGEFRIDYLLPDFSLAIEYDETHHSSKIEADIERMNRINEAFWLVEGLEDHEEPPKWIRVNENEELLGIERIIEELCYQEIGF